MSNILEFDLSIHSLELEEFADKVSDAYLNGVPLRITIGGVSWEGKIYAVSTEYIPGDLTMRFTGRGPLLREPV